jgi:hypothetical protein
VPVAGELVLTGRRSALLSIDGADHRSTAGGMPGLLDEGRPSCVPISRLPDCDRWSLTVSVGRAGPVRMAVQPDGNASFHYGDA